MNLISTLPWFEPVSIYIIPLPPNLFSLLFIFRHEGKLALSELSETVLSFGPAVTVMLGFGFLASGKSFDDFTCKACIGKVSAILIAKFKQANLGLIFSIVPLHFRPILSDALKEKDTGSKLLKKSRFVTCYRL